VILIVMAGGALHAHMQSLPGRPTMKEEVPGTPWDTNTLPKQHDPYAFDRAVLDEDKAE
jgi:hypothetical protein